MGRRSRFTIGATLVAAALAVVGRSVIARQDDPPVASPAPGDPGRPITLPTPPRNKPKPQSKSAARPLAGGVGGASASTQAPTPPADADRIPTLPPPPPAPGGFPDDPGPAKLGAVADVGPELPVFPDPTAKPLPPASKLDPRLRRAAAPPPGPGEPPSIPPPQEPLPPQEPPPPPPPETPLLPTPEAPTPPAATPSDPSVERVDAPGGDGRGPSLPPAAERPGSTPPPSSGAAPETFALPPDRLQSGSQKVGLTVEVVAPQYLNLNQPAALKVVIRNHTVADAMGVDVRDKLPANLTYVSSQPEAQVRGDLLSWTLGTVPANTERTITLNVTPTKVGAFEHAATVTMMTGGKSRTLVREPKLEVNVTSPSGKVLKGQPVRFTIVVTNPGDGPARNVTVKAKLSAGLRHASGETNDQNLFWQTIPRINPGDRVTLDTLEADTTQGGEQSCLVEAASPDVHADSAAKARFSQAVQVVEPRLTLALTGPEQRYTDILARYELTVENPGSAPAKNVQVQATIPPGAQLHALPSGAKWDAQALKLTWTKSQLDPGESLKLAFEARMGGVGLCQIAAEARGSGVPAVARTVNTDVTGLAVVDIDVTERRRVVDVSDMTTYVIRVKNSGTKEATRVAISADLSSNLKAEETYGTTGPDPDKGAPYNDALKKVVFPLIDRIGPGKTVELGIKVQALAPGLATCRVFLMHDELTEKLDDVAAFKVAAPTRR